VSNVAVSAAARRRGVARRLMAEVEATAAGWGFRCVSLVRAGAAGPRGARGPAVAGWAGEGSSPGARSALVREAPPGPAPRQRSLPAAWLTSRIPPPPLWRSRCPPKKQHCDASNSAAWQLYRELGYRRVALEAPWAPYLNGRPPRRCWLLLKRLPSALVAAGAARGGGAAAGEAAEAAAAGGGAQQAREPAAR
jgi:GNAT superfamily N-acetyltransferase